MRRTINIDMRFREIIEAQTIKLRGFGSKPRDPNAPASKFLDELEEQCTINPLNDRAIVWQNKAVLVIGRSPSEPHDHVELNDIHAMVRGGGALAMKMLCELADKHGVSLYLYAKGYDTVPTKKLVEFYKRFGFDDFGVDLRYLDDVAKLPGGAWEDHEGVDMERKPH